jgi:hypothetical protein
VAEFANGHLLQGRQLLLALFVGHRKKGKGASRL